ncbi:NAD(P)-dependent oxidoreductase [Paenibacillus polymyxa]|jgi:3-hydroxyisobutyrate dehydrogenase|uniref:NAD(P)-dependent oxidoreductase n=1 Tax=Paenibacillus polymyxa TaxID=1406 RepID=UPI0002F87F8E|nr:NAD(P)-dependent oxidoreductase [Paenibacillus polymyxa]AHM64996.1 3-hydroxyisobutyrate dehydrogenase [Paenibacillus polymyxa SQR-21]AIY10591.1 3-hydroxyisobutyrate dehydrogenase [Paenibacillus polymyxa]MDN4076809.1 NAD(P)-dependent oxidoreductase [Paenibacillus polymyxa]MDN4084835.1 NAD(P)-dependent oxidoreductase [Paenibacillus polymyxa]MDN4086759.1 NAD(P)-dependent oxidoreductase [Paenibacillus polymyxa]
MKNIGFIGLGTMGAPMASNLLKQGFGVTVYNRTASRCEPLVEQGARAASTPREAAEGQHLVITMVSDDQSIRDVYYGQDGVFAGLTAGMTVMDNSTISPELVKQLAVEADKLGCSFIDAPVTGSKPAAVDGTLVFMVGGHAEAIAAQSDVFDTLGKKVLHMGPNGSGAVAKLAHNTMVGINNLALAEGFAIAAKSGIPADSFLELVQLGSAGSKAADLKGRKIIEHDFSNQFSLALMLKDLKLAASLTDSLSIPTPMLSIAKSLFQAGQTQGYGDEDLSAVVKTYEAWIGRTIGGQPLE